MSQHLAALRARNVVTVRREGTQAYYALRSPLIADLLRVAREFLNHHLSESSPRASRCCASSSARRRKGDDDGQRAWAALAAEVGPRAAGLRPRDVPARSHRRASPSAWSRCRWRWRSPSPRACTPQAGIYCAIVTGFLISALGGSRVQIGGPTGAFVVVVSGIVAEYGVSGLFMCTMMAGVMLVILGVTGTGTAVRFIPRPVVIGFTNGIAVLIASTQIRDFLGLRMAENPGEFLGRLAAIGRHLDTLTPAAVGLAVLTLAARRSRRTASSR